LFAIATCGDVAELANTRVAVAAIVVGGTCFASGTCGAFVAAAIDVCFRAVEFSIAATGRIAVMGDARPVGAVRVHTAGSAVEAGHAAAAAIDVTFSAVEFRVVASGVVTNLVDTRVALRAIGITKAMFGIGAGRA